MPDLTCIYCREEISSDGFNTEHVISRSFGTFENNLTLTDMLCRTCNQFFGDNLEVVFARDSLEAYDRLQHGQTTSVENWPHDRLTFTAAVDGEWSGLRLRLDVSNGIRTVQPVAQVGLPKVAEAGWTYLTESELADPAVVIPTDYDRQGQIRILAPSDEMQDRLVSLLSERGISFQLQGNFELPQLGDEIEIYVNTMIDPLAKRCIAKMVFNYLAYMTDREFVLKPDFDPIRAYVRYGVAPEYLLVDADDTPILADDSRTLRQTDGHIVTINWTSDNNHIVGQISLFNRVTYRISLARNYSGLWRPIRNGHHFDLEARMISPMAATSLLVPRAQ